MNHEQNSCNFFLDMKIKFNIKIKKKYKYLKKMYIVICQIKVITKLPNSEQSYKGKVKTHNYINRQNQSTTGKL